LASITAVTSVHIAAYIEDLGRTQSVPTVKQHLAAIRMMFDWLATGGILPFNPASAVRGPRHVVKRGKTPVLDPHEARQLLDSIDVSSPAGLRDRALIGLMVYTFARIGAATAMTVADVYTQNRRLWVNLREKGGQVVDPPCHHTLETHLHAYLDSTGLAADRDGPLFRTIGRGTGQLTRTPCPRPMLTP
jgi:integrase/recombinase XerD